RCDRTVCHQSLGHRAGGPTMKRTTWLILIAGGLAGPGCLGLEKVFQDTRVEPIKAEALPSAPPLLNASQINDQNAQEMANALSDELDRAERQTPARRAPAHANIQDR